MSVTAATNLQMGISCMDGNGFHTQKLYNLSSSSGFCFKFRPKMNKQQVLNLRMPAISALKGGDSGLGDFEFKPSFDEYLKVMESVKTGRDSNQARPSTGSSPNRSLKVELGKDKFRVSEVQDSGEGVAGGEKISSSNGGKRNFKDTRKVGFGERGNTRGELESRQDEMAMRVKEKLDVGASLVKIIGQSRYAEYDEPRVKGRLGVDTNNVKKQGQSRNADYDEPRARRKLGVDTNHVKDQGQSSNTYYDEPRARRTLGVDTNLVKDQGQSRNAYYDEPRARRTPGVDTNLIKDQWQSGNAYYDEPRSKTNRQRPVISSRPSGNYANHVGQMGIAENREGVSDEKRSWGIKKIVQYNSDDDMIEERAAFKSMEVLDDPYDKPRVSRVDMEERIQTLAKCLNGADVDMPEWIFSKMIKSAKIRFSDHSVLRLIQILGKFGNWRRVLQVVEWFQLRERFKSHKIRYIYTAAIDALGKARRPTEALNLFNAMKQQMSSYPDLVAYRTIAVTLGQAGYMKELFDVIDSMRSPPEKKFKTMILQKWDPRLEPDLIVYNAVLNACVRRKNWEGSFWVLQQLKQQGLQPSITTYGLVMEVMFASGNYNLVHEFFKKIQKSYIPNALTYKVLVNTLWRQGNVDDAVLAVQDMERRGIVGSAGLYYDLARCLCSAGRCQEAIMQIAKISKVANKPLVVTYTGLIQACLDHEKIESAIFIFNHMLDICPPNLVTCNIMLKGYLDFEMFEEAKQLFQKLLDNGNNIRSIQDYKERVLPDIYTFNLMLDACAVKSRWEDLEYIYEKMLQRGYHFNAKRHLRLVMDACRTGKVKLLETTWNHLGQMDQLPPHPLIKEMFRLKLEQDDFPAAISCIASVPLSESHKFTPKSWLSFFRENALFFQKDVLVQLIQEVSIVISQSDSPNLIFENLIASCKEFLRTEEMTVAEIEQRRDSAFVS